MSFDKDKITLEELKKTRKQMAKDLPVIPGADIKLGRQEGAESQNWVGVNLYGEDPSKLQDLAREARHTMRAHARLLPRSTPTPTRAARKFRSG